MLNNPALLLALSVNVTVRLYASVTVMEPMESPRMEAVLPDMLFFVAL